MIYLDNSATTRPFNSVSMAMLEAQQEEFFNPSALYGQAMLGEEMLKRFRGAVRDALSLPMKEWDVVLTSGGTESDNLAIMGTALARRGRKGLFLAGAAEHPAVLKALEAVHAMGHDTALIPVDERGIVTPERLEPLLREDTALVSVGQVGSESGAVQPIAALAAMVKAICPRALFHCDGAQGFLRVGLSSAHVDLYSISAHKVHGPKGVGALARRKGVQLLPLLHGGGQEDGLRSGTENTIGALGFAAAIDAFASMKGAVKEVRQHKLRLWQAIMNRVPEALVNGPEPDSPEAAPHILNLSFPVASGETLLHALEGKGLLVSTRSACSTRRNEKGGPLRAMGLTEERVRGAIRFSLSVMNTEEEMAEAAQMVSDAVEEMTRFRRR